jgi:group I intron endonuclease
MYYIVYKITNQINGKIYIGSHKTKNLNDNYMGSGKYLKRAQEKYGMENFIKEILFVFDTPELMYTKESELVTEDFIAEENTYNMKVGGYGGFDYLNDPTKYNNKSHSVEQCTMMSMKVKEYYPNGTMYGRKHSDESIQKMRQSKLGNQTFLGRKHSDETKDKMRNSALGKQDAEKNSQFGTIWITNGSENRKINKIDEIPDGWRKGRVIK